MRQILFYLLFLMVFVSSVQVHAQGDILEEVELTPLPGEVIKAWPDEEQRIVVQPVAPKAQTEAVMLPEPALVVKKQKTENEIAKEEIGDFFSARNVARHGKYLWGGPYHDDVRVYLNKAKIPHSSQWADEKWSPQDWIDARGGQPLKVIDGFYRVGIIKDQTMKDGMPLLEVGDAFLQLSDLEKMRVVTFIDHVFGITRNDESGSIHIVYEEETFLFGLYSGLESVGFFTKDGLQLQ
ncbi:MAG: hypothetical protein KTR28_02645 [Micavibrio sp.]|nr:hypothetical protein [Micavibrio sp.]